MKRLERFQLLSLVHHRFARSAENIATVSKSVVEDPNVSIPRRSQELGLSYGTLWHILHLHLYLHSYKVQLTQKLKPADYSQRRTYVGMGAFSAMKHISLSVGMLTNKIIAFRVLRILK